MSDGESLKSWTNWPLAAQLELLASLRREKWRRQARTEQLPPDGDWRFWYLRGGRGSGKTRTGAETLADWILEHEAGDWAVIAPTYGDARDVCMEGGSGLLKALSGAYDRKAWNRSLGTLTLLDGSKVFIDGADDGAERIQGKNLRGAWCDEVGLWKQGWEVAWKESLRLAVRFSPARLICTGTPKQAHPLVRLLLKHPQCVVTHMKTWDNAENLDPQWLEELVKEYEGTRRGRQELEGEFLDEPLGALWTLSQIRALDREMGRRDELSRIVVGVDPSGTPHEDTGTSETGIVVCGHSSYTNQAFVLDDLSAHASPQDWGKRVVNAYYQHSADVVVAERNFGGEMVRTVIHAVDRNVPVKLVTASRGKAQRAEPVAAKYEQGIVHHVREFAALEEQMCSFIPGDLTQASPDRMDALVWALTELLIAPGDVQQLSYVSEWDEPVYKRGDLTLIGEKYIDLPSPDY